MKDKLSKILIIEDEEDIRTIAKFALVKKGGFNVKFCESGEEALREAAIFGPDLILLDVMMPGLDGIQTFKELKKIPSVASIPIIFMTAKAQANEIKFYKELGAIDVISKPFNAANLASDLNQIWQKYKD